MKFTAALLIAAVLALSATAQPLAEANGIQARGDGRPNGEDQPTSGIKGPQEDPLVDAPKGSPNVYTNGGVRWTYQGCFSDRSDKDGRALHGTSTVSNARTIEGCLRTCAKGNYKYAGLEYGSECRCGHDLASFSKAGAKCETKCSSKNGQTCGGNYALSLYKS
ncbi:unnamed protein product [Parajaminaea phylloscopi]